MKAYAKSSASEVVLTAKVTRADGRVEYLGEIAHYYRSPLKRMAWRCKRWLR